MGRHAHELPDEAWRLWTRGGTDGVSIKNMITGEEVEIPSNLLRMLVASDVLSNRISKLEQMEDDEILGLE